MHTNEKVYAYTTHATLRASFWQDHPQYKRRPGWSQTDYATDIRCAFVDYVDALQKSGQISESLAQRVTL